jgi:hypothetical protein
MEQTFTIRTYGFGELAQKYFPAVSPKTASTNLNNWIKSDPGLHSALFQAGRRPGFKILSPAQVRLIVDAFGEP